MEGNIHRVLHLDGKTDNFSQVVYIYRGRERENYTLCGIRGYGILYDQHVNIWHDYHVEI